MLRTVSTAHELDSEAGSRYPHLSQELIQWKPRTKGKKQKSQIDDTRNEISYSASIGGDADLETSTNAGKDLGTLSFHSVGSKRSKKRNKKSQKETSGSVHSASASAETPETSEDVPVEVSYLVTLDCPLCYDTDCILNKASTCPFLRHNDAKVTNECCMLCGTHCRCEENKLTSLPVSGLVARDENGVAVTLLKANRGPIENSFEWANRQRWVVPSHVKWEHKISEWVTAPLLGTSKAEASSHQTKSRKSKSRTRSKAVASSLTVAPEQNSNSEEPRVEEDDQEVLLLIEGQGFKIFEKGVEKILINYDRKNCRLLGCSCLPIVDTVNCGCEGSPRGREKGTTKPHKSSPNKRNVSLLKETSHGLLPIQKELDEKFAKEKSNLYNRPAETPNKEDRESHNPKLSMKVTIDEADHKDANHEKSNKLDQDEDKKKNLSGKDLRNRSRAEVLEASLRSILGTEYKNSGTESPALQNQQTQERMGVPCPVLDQPGPNYVVGNIGSCICRQGCPFFNHQQ